MYLTISGNNDGDMTDIDVEGLIRNIKMYSRMDFLFSYKNYLSDIMGYSRGAKTQIFKYIRKREIKSTKSHIKCL